MDVGLDALFCAGASICGCHDHIGHNVQAPRHIQYRYSSLYVMALSAVGHKTVLESGGGSVRHQAEVDRADGDVHSHRICRYRIYHTAYIFLSGDTGGILGGGFSERDSRHCRRRLLHACIVGAPAVVLCRHTKYVLPYSHDSGAGSACDACRLY